MKPGPEETLSFRVGWYPEHGNVLVTIYDPLTGEERIKFGVDLYTARRMGEALLGVVEAREARGPGMDA